MFAPRLDADFLQVLRAGRSWVYLPRYPQASQALCVENKATCLLHLLPLMPALPVTASLSGLSINLEISL